MKIVETTLRLRLSPLFLYLSANYDAEIYSVLSKNYLAPDKNYSAPIYFNMPSNSAYKSCA